MLTDLGFVRVGHSTDLDGITGCTVIIYDVPTVCGVDVRGINPGTHNTDLLRSSISDKELDAIVLTGGSMYGFAVLPGVLRFLEENNRGFVTRSARIPMVSSAVIYDLEIGNSSARPTEGMGYQACKNVSKEGYEKGSVGAGTGATIGKLYGIKYATKGGIGSSTIKLYNNIIMSALVVVNSFGDVIDPKSNNIIAGTRKINGGYVNTYEKMKKGHRLNGQFDINTTLGVVATNAKLSREEANYLARTAQNGIAKVISPAHTTFDGDTIFATGCKESSLNTSIDVLASMASEAMSLAIVDAVKSSTTLGNVFDWRSK